MKHYIIPWTLAIALGLIASTSIRCNSDKIGNSDGIIWENNETQTWITQDNSHARVVTVLNASDIKNTIRDSKNRTLEVDMSCTNRQAFSGAFTGLLEYISNEVKNEEVLRVIWWQTLYFPENLVPIKERNDSCEDFFQHSKNSILQLEILFNFLRNNPTLIDEFDGQERNFVPYEEYPTVPIIVTLPTKTDLYNGKFDIHSTGHIQIYLDWLKKVKTLNK